MSESTAGSRDSLLRKLSILADTGNRQVGLAIAGPDGFGREIRHTPFTTDEMRALRDELSDAIADADRDLAAERKAIRGR